MKKIMLWRWSLMIKPEAPSSECGGFITRLVKWKVEYFSSFWSENTQNTHKMSYYNKNTTYKLIYISFYLHYVNLNRCHQTFVTFLNYHPLIDHSIDLFTRSEWLGKTSRFYVSMYNPQWWIYWRIWGVKMRIIYGIWRYAFHNTQFAIRH